MQIRKATPQDAPQLSRTAETMFRDTFAPDNDPAQIERYCAEAFSTERQRAELARVNARTVVADDSGAIVGYAQLLLSDEDWCEIERFYIERSRHGSGLAQQLMQASMDLAKDAGYAVMRLGVWKENARAIAFYQKLGFKIVGEQVFMLGTEEQHDYVMTREMK